MLNIVVLGAGAIAATHVDALLQSSDLCHITAVCNRHVEKAQKLIREKGLEASAYSTLEEAFAAEVPDAVVICTAPALHCEAAIWAMEHGSAVLVEKPMANSLEECDRMIDASRRCGVLLSVICQMRFTTEAQRLRTLLRMQEFGPLRYASVDSLWWRGPQYHDPAWRGTWESEGGGVLTSQALHHIDLLQYLIGMPLRVTAAMGNVGHPNTQCEDVASAVLEYPDAFVQLSASLVAQGEQQSLRFYCQDGSLSIPWEPTACRAMPNGYPASDPEQLAKLNAVYNALPELSLQRHPAQIRNFLLALLGEEPLAVDGAEGRKPIELITAIYASASTHTPVSLPLPPESPFYTLAGKAANLPVYHEKKHSVDTTEAQSITFPK